MAVKLIREKAACRLSTRTVMNEYACGVCGRVKFVEAGHCSRTKGCQVCSNTRHGMARRSGASPIYRLWSWMISRCENKKSTNYRFYGGRGISVCSEWRRDFSEFAAWCERNGWDRSLQLDRIDVNGNYSPDNCRFVTCQVNSQNKRGTKLTHDDVRAIRMLSWSGLGSKRVSDIFGVSQSTVRNIMLWKSWSNV